MCIINVFWITHESIKVIKSSIICTLKCYYPCLSLSRYYRPFIPGIDALKHLVKIQVDYCLCSFSTSDLRATLIDKPHNNQVDVFIHLRDTALNHPNKSHSHEDGDKGNGKGRQSVPT